MAGALALVVALAARGAAADIVYRRVARAAAGLDSLGADRLAVVLALNRVDREHAARLDSLVVPDGDPPLAALSPFPDTLAAAADLQKLIVVAPRVQAFAAYACGRQVRWGPTSTGRRASPTPEGLFHTQWQARLRASTVNSDWLMPWYWNLDNASGLSIHAYVLPGRPASHACIRLTEPDARWLFAWADGYQVAADGRDVLRQGTPVVVVGAYDFGAAPPWTRLAGDARATTIGAEELAPWIERARAPLDGEPVSASSAGG